MIRVTDVDKTFSRRGQEIEALRGVSLDIADGEFVSLLGPSGCGKSTLLRIIGGLHDVSGGTVTIGGTTPAAARGTKTFGLVPQAPALVPWKTLKANVRFLSDMHRRAGPPPMPDAEIEALIHTVGLDRFVHAYPHEMSGGMQQRASLVRAFALGAPILLMDEPFAALDEITRADMRYLLLDLWTQRRGTVVFVTHSVTEAVILSDRVVVMAAHPGRIQAVHDIDLPRPRVPAIEDTDAFHHYVSELRAELRGAHAPAGRRDGPAIEDRPT
jgi:NitT/TauT family transport system ATP-binding protein